MSKTALFLCSLGSCHLIYEGVGFSGGGGMFNKPGGVSKKVGRVSGQGACTNQFGHKAARGGRGHLKNSES